jgi:hypothetical protein
MATEQDHRRLNEGPPEYRQAQKIRDVLARLALPFIGMLVLLGAPVWAQPAGSPVDRTGLERFEQRVRALGDAGERVDAVDLKTWPTLPDERNAARPLAELARRLMELGQKGAATGACGPGAALFTGSSR